MELDLYRQILDSLPDGVTVQDRNFNVIYQNKVMIEAFGDCIGKKCYKNYEKRDEICEGCGILKAYQTNKTHLVIRTAFEKNGSTSYWENACAPLQDNKGNIIAGVEICRNITDRISLEKEVKQRNIELGQVNKELKHQATKLEKTLSDLKSMQMQMIETEKMASIGLLAAGVAHEINNPISFVLSNLQTLENYVTELKAILELNENLCTELQIGLSNEVHKIISRINEIKKNEDISYIIEDINELFRETRIGTRRIRDIVQKLKSFAQVDYAEGKEVNINDCIESTLKMIWNKTESKCQLRMRLGSLPLIYCYPQQLNQVFMNIILNSSQAIAQDGVITITSEMVNDAIIVKISDNGCGIPADNTSRIFDPFFTTKSVGSGMGLGLSMSYGIIKKHGGTIEVESTENVGTTFTIRLPFKAV